MAMNILPLDATAGTPAFTAQQTRQALSVLFGTAPSGRPLGATSGVRPGTPTTTVFLTGASSTTWNVAAHSGALDTQTSALAGPYAYSTDGTDTGTITAADPTNPRVDIIYVKVNDNVQDGSGLTNGQVGYLAGNPAASPSAPTPPPRAMVLATIAVPKVGSGAPAASWVAPTFGDPITWTSFTPVWKQVGGTVLSIGAGSLTGKYRLVGKTLDLWIRLVRASDSNLGTAAHLFELPSGFTAASFQSVICAASVFDSSASTAGMLPHQGTMLNNTDIAVVSTSGRRIDQNGFGTGPTAWATGDEVRLAARLELA